MRYRDRSPRRFASVVASERPARVLECASPLALWVRRRIDDPRIKESALEWWLYCIE